VSVHSKIGASSYHRWKMCPGSVKLSEGVESKSSPYAEEGTRAHELAALALRGLPWTEGAPPEMVEAIDIYQRAVGIEGEIWIEQRLDLSKVYPGMFGTADAVVHKPSEELLQILDFKFGAGIAVEVEENEQLLYYALGAILNISLERLPRWIELVIVQPRCPHPDGPVRRWRTTIEKLKEFETQLKKDAAATESPNAILAPGGHCRFCPAAGFCPALHEKAISLAQEDFSKDLTYDAEVLGRALSWLPALESWISRVREFAYSEAMQGRITPGYKLVQKRPSRKWRNEKEVITVLEKDFGLKGSEIFKQDLKSPTQIEKYLDKEGKKELQKLYVSESSGMTLAPEEDPREPIRNDPKSDFIAFLSDSES
jgi:hypothetical protein